MSRGTQQLHRFCVWEIGGLGGLRGHFKDMGSSISVPAPFSWSVPVLKACHCVSLAVGNPPWEAHQRRPQEDKERGAREAGQEAAAELAEAHRARAPE